MKLTKGLKKWSLRMVLFTILLSGLSMQKAYSSCNDTIIPMHGNWKESNNSVGSRSPSPFPITVCTDDQNMDIENTSPDCDIQISIISHKTGEVMFQQLVPKTQTGYIVRSIANFPTGEYRLELTGEAADNHLIGDFYK